MAEKQDEDGLQPDGKLVFTVILTPEIAARFLRAMELDEREQKSEFARLMIKRQLVIEEEKRAIDELRRLRSGESVPHVPGVLPVEQNKTG